MKTSRNVIAGLLVAAGLASAGAIAYANPDEFVPGWGGRHQGMTGPGMMGGAMGMMGMGMMGGGGMGAGAMDAQNGPATHIDGRLAYAKAELKITPAQESAWQTYAKQAKLRAESMQTLHTQAPAAAQTLPERLSQRTEFMKRRMADMESMSVALTALYAALTPEQKTVADRYFGGAHMSQSCTRGYRHGRGVPGTWCFSRHSGCRLPAGTGTPGFHTQTAYLMDQSHTRRLLEISPQRLQRG